MDDYGPSDAVEYEPSLGSADAELTEAAQYAAAGVGAAPYMSAALTDSLDGDAGSLLASLAQAPTPYDPPHQLPPNGGAGRDALATTAAAAAAASSYGHGSGVVDLTSATAAASSALVTRPAATGSMAGTSTLAASALGASSAAVAPLGGGGGGASMADRLAVKVRDQAKELMRLRAEVKDRREYATLVERRLLEFAPGHDIPVTAATLGTDLPPPTKAPASASAGGGAAARRNTSSRTDREWERLERQRSVAQRRLKEALSQVKSLRRQVESKEEEVGDAVKKSQELATRLGEMEAKLRHGGSQSHVDRKRRRDAKAASEERVEAMLSELASTQHKLEVATQQLSQESQEVEKQRAYIAVLEQTVQVRADEAGLHGQGQMLTELARLRGELNACSKDLEAREGACRDMERRLADVEAQRDGLKADNERLRAGQLGLDELASGDVPEGDLKGTVLQLQAQKTALLDYVQETSDAKTALQARVDELTQAGDEAREALADARGARTAAEAQASAAQGRVQELEAEVEAQRERLQQAEARATEHADAAANETELRAVQEQLLDNIRQLNERAATAEQALETVKGRAATAEHAARAMRTEHSSAATEIASLSQHLADAQATITARDAMLREVEREKANLQTMVEELRGRNEAKTAEAVQADRRAATSAASMAAVKAANQGLETSLAKASAELDALRSLRSHVDRLEAHMAAVYTAEDDHNAERRAAATAAASASVSAAAAGDGDAEGKGAGPDDNGTYGAASAVAVEGPVERGAALVTRAERSLKWAAGPEMATALPETSAAVRRLCNWLRTAGVELGDAGRRLAVETRDRVAQRRMLHDEIHALRKERDSLHTRAETLDTELLQARAGASEASERLGGEVASLQKQLQQAHEEAEGATERAGQLEQQLADEQRNGRNLKAQLDEARAATSAANDGAERSAGRVERLTNNLAEVTATRDELANQTAALTTEVAEARRVVDSVTLEKRVLTETLAALETTHRDTQAEVATLRDERDAAQGMAEELGKDLAQVRAAHEELQQQHEELQGRHEQEEQEWRQKEATMQHDLEDAAQLAERQQELAQDLEAANGDMRNQNDVVQRSMIGMTMEMEGARKKLEGALQAAAAAAAVSSSSGVPQPALTAGDDAPSGSISKALHHSVDRAAQFIRANAAAQDGLAKQLLELQTAHDAAQQQLAQTRPQMAALAEAGSSARQRAEAMVAGRATISQLRAELASAETRMNVMQQENDALRQQLVDAQTECERASARIAELVSQVEQQRERLAATQAEVHASQGHAQQLRHQLQAEHQRAATAHDTTSRLRAKGGDNAQALGSALGDVDRLQGQLSRQQERLRGLEDRLVLAQAKERDANTSVAQLEQRVATVTAQLTAKAAEAADWKRRYDGAARQVQLLRQGVTADLGQLTSENEDLVRRHSDVLSRLAVAEAELKTVRSDASSLRTQLRQSEAQLANATRHLHGASEQRDGAQAEARQLRSELEALRVQASGAVSARQEEEGQLAKVIRSKENLERELLQALKENEQLRQQRHADMHRNMGALVAAAPISRGPTATAVVSRRPGALTAAPQAVQPGREYTVHGSPGTTLRVSRAGSIRINLPPDHPDHPASARRPAAAQPPYPPFRSTDGAAARYPTHPDPVPAGLRRAPAGASARPPTTDVGRLGGTKAPARPGDRRYRSRANAWPQPAAAARTAPVRPRPVATHSAPSSRPPTAGAARLQDRLRNMHAAFAELRKSAVR